MRIEYSSALCFGKSIDNPICRFKSQLSKVLNRSDKSLNAEPHVTFNSFIGDMRELNRAKSYLANFCNQIDPFKIRLNRFGVFESSGVIYLALDEESYELVNRIMKSLHGGWAGKADKKYSPHVTIARDLSSVDLQIAKGELLGLSVDVELTCSHLSLRRRIWNETQFSVINEFKFKGQKENLLFS